MRERKWVHETPGDPAIPQALHHHPRQLPLGCPEGRCPQAVGWRTDPRTVSGPDPRPAPPRPPGRVSSGLPCPHPDRAEPGARLPDGRSVTLVIPTPTTNTRRRGRGRKEAIVMAPIRRSCRRTDTVQRSGVLSDGSGRGTPATQGLSFRGAGG